MHRYQIEATTKLIGGLDYNYKIKDDNQPNHKWVSEKEQNDALKALLYTISPDQLEVPEHVLTLIPPRPFGYGKNRETFVSRTGLTFDPIAPAESIVDLTFNFIFNEARADRIYLQNLQNSNLPSFDNVLTTIEKQVFSNNLPKGLNSEIKLMTEAKMIDHMIALAKSTGTSNSVRAIVRGHLDDLKDTVLENRESSGEFHMHSEYLIDKIEAFLDLPVELTIQEEIKSPDGSPIGMDIMSCDFDF